MEKLNVGDQAPDFTLPDQTGKKHVLRTYRRSWVLLYFYPKDDTPGCTKEACALRDNFPNYKKKGIVILGVSVDAVSKHEKFAKKYELPFTILADEDKSVVKSYGVWAKKKFMGREYMGTLRMSFLIDPYGRIVKIYEHVKPELHASEVLADAASLEKM